MTLLSYPEEKLHSTSFYDVLPQEDLATESAESEPGLLDQVSDVWASVRESFSRPTEEVAEAETEEQIQDYELDEVQEEEGPGLFDQLSDYWEDVKESFSSESEEEEQQESFDEEIQDDDLDVEPEEQESTVFSKVTNIWERVKQEWTVGNEDEVAQVEHSVHEPEVSHSVAKLENMSYIASDQRNIPGIYVDNRKVSNEEYQRFVDETGHPAPLHWGEDRMISGTEDDFVVNVSYEDAEAYASWAGKRLPSEEEWQHARDEQAFEDNRDYVNEWTGTPSLSSGKGAGHLQALLQGSHRVVKSKNQREVSPMKADEFNSYTGFRCVQDVR